MQFTTITTFILAAATCALSAPVAVRGQGGIQCHQSGSQWYWNWSNSQQDQNYNCQSSGTLNVLTCVSVLDGSNLSVPILNILNGGGLGSITSGLGGLRQ